MRPRSTSAECVAEGLAFRLFADMPTGRGRVGEFLSFSFYLEVLDKLVLSRPGAAVLEARGLRLQSSRTVGSGDRGLGPNLDD